MPDLVTAFDAGSAGGPTIHRALRPSTRGFEEEKEHTMKRSLVLMLLAILVPGLVWAQAYKGSVR